MNRFLLAIISLEHTRELRPGISCCTAVRQAGIDLQLTHAATALTDNRRHAVIACIAAANNNDVLILRINRQAISKITVQKALGHAFQIILRKIDTAQLAPLDRQITRHGRASAEHNSVKLLSQRRGSKLYAHLAVQHKLHAGSLQQLNAALHDLLIQLHVRHAVHQQASGTVGTLIHSHAVACLVQLIGTGQTRRPAADNCHPFARALRRDVRLHQSLLKGVFNNILLQITNRHRIIHQTCIARALAGSRADMRGKLREIICFVQACISISIHAMINKVIELRHQVMQRTAGDHTANHQTAVAEGHTAVHAACSLTAQCLLLRQAARLDFLPIVNAFFGGTQGQLLTLIIHKSSRLTHYAFTSSKTFSVASSRLMPCCKYSLSFWVTALYSFGMTFTNLLLYSSQLSRTSCARVLPVYSA